MKLHQLEGYIQDIYLAEYEHGLFLLDGCCRADVDLILSYFTSTLNRPITDLKCVITTHAHPDHMGATQQLKNMSGCKIVGTKVSKPWYVGLDGYLMFLTDLLLTKYVAKRKGKKPKYLWYNRKALPDLMINDGDPLPGFEDWTCIYTQGHTDRDLSLFHKKTNQIYVADLIVKVKGKFVPPFPIFYPNRYKNSLEKLNDLAVETIILAHGGFIQLSAQEFEYLQQKAPDIPVTHWRSVKKKLQKIFSN